MRKLILIVILILASGSLFGCNSNEAATIEFSNQTIPQSPSDSYELVGKIIEFGPGTVELLYNGRLMTFPLATMETTDFYLGEIVGVTRIENELFLDDFVYSLTAMIKADAAERESAMGETIYQLNGIIETVNNNNFSIQTNEGLIWIETYDNQDLIPGEEMKIDYLNWGDHQMMVQCYDESMRFLMTITEKGRSESGHLILNGTNEEGIARSIQLATNTVINFSHATLQLGDTLAVYPRSPITTNTKAISPKRVDRIQLRTHRTIVKPILK